mmetsp:Transcript_31889/g.63275  ORF Transcript_31889/g.63275 Transcript_31889/m.63275 type:complete len:204 (-) Transcript_31889:103-714(-)
MSTQDRHHPRPKARQCVDEYRQEPDLRLAAEVKVGGRGGHVFASTHHDPCFACGENAKEGQPHRRYERQEPCQRQLGWWRVDNHRTGNEEGNSRLHTFLALLAEHAECGEADFQRVQQICHRVALEAAPTTSLSDHSHQQQACEERLPGLQENPHTVEIRRYIAQDRERRSAQLHLFLAGARHWDKAKHMFDLVAGMEIHLRQ